MGGALFENSCARIHWAKREAHGVCARIHEAKRWSRCAVHVEAGLFFLLLSQICLPMFPKIAETLWTLKHAPVLFYIITNDDIITMVHGVGFQPFKCTSMPYIYIYK